MNKKPSRKNVNFVRRWQVVSWDKECSSEVIFRQIISVCLTSIRQSRGITQSSLARRTRTSLSLIREFENGEELPNLSQLHALASALEFDPDELLSYAETAAKAMGVNAADAERSIH